MKSLSFALLLCLCTTALTAQESISFGPILGANFAKVSTDGEADPEFNTGFVAGAQLTHSNINNWGVGGAILYSREGVDYQIAGQETALNLTYLRIPIKGFIFFRDNENTFRPKLFFGPSLGFLMDADFKSGDVELDVKDTYNTFDLGLTAGLGFNARIVEGTWFNFDAGYTHGLLDVAENGDGSNRTITITGGVAFGF